MARVLVPLCACPTLLTSVLVPFAWPLTAILQAVELAAVLQAVAVVSFERLVSARVHPRAPPTSSVSAVVNEIEPLAVASVGSKVAKYVVLAARSIPSPEAAKEMVVPETPVDASVARRLPGWLLAFDS